MKKGALPATEWLAAALEATKEVAKSSLACTRVEVREQSGEAPKNRAGAYVPLLSAQQSLQVGLLSTEHGCQKMTKALLGMEDDGECPTKDDVADAVGEIVNIVAGVIKGRVFEQVSSVQLGLPLFVWGELAFTGNLESLTLTVDLDEISAELVVLCRKT